MTATLARRAASRSTTALTKAVVPMVTDATSLGAMPAEANMVLMAEAMPALGSGVVGALVHARMPRDGSVGGQSGLRSTPVVGGVVAAVARLGGFGSAGWELDAR